MEITRQRFRNIKKRIGKGDLEDFKSLINEVYDEAYKEMMTKGIFDVKNTLMDAIKEVLNKEFKIGETRFNKFLNSLDTYLDNFDIIGTNREEIIGEQCQMFKIEEKDKVTLIVILCIRQFLININKIESGVYADKDIKLIIGSALKTIMSLEDMISSRLSSDEIKEIFDRASKSMLYVLSKEEVKNLDNHDEGVNSIIVTVDKFCVTILYEDKRETFLYRNEDIKLIGRIQELLKTKAYRVVVINTDIRGQMVTEVLKKANIQVYSTLKGE